MQTLVHLFFVAIINAFAGLIKEEREQNNCEKCIYSNPLILNVKFWMANTFLYCLNIGIISIQNSAPNTLKYILSALSGLLFLSELILALIILIEAIILFINHIKGIRAIFNTKFWMANTFLYCLNIGIISLLNTTSSSTLKYILSALSGLLSLSELILALIILIEVIFLLINRIKSMRKQNIVSLE